MESTFIFGVIGILLGAALVFFVLRFYIEKQKQEQIQVVDHKVGVKRVKSRSSYTRDHGGKLADETKRNSLQPGNSKHVRAEKAKELKDIKNFEHKFFGTVLEVENRILIRGLQKRLHTFEIVDGVSYCDGHPVTIHPDEILRLVRSAE